MTHWTDRARNAWTQSIADKHNAMRREWLVALILARKSSAWREIGVPEKVADKLRAGWAIYNTLRHYDARKARELRNKYSYRRFMEMGALWVKYEFEPEQAISHLESDLTISGMTMQIIDAHSPYCEWQRKAFGLSKSLDVIAAIDDAPAEWRELAEQARKLLQKYGDVK